MYVEILAVMLDIYLDLEETPARVEDHSHLLTIDRCEHHIFPRDERHNDRGLPEIPMDSIVITNLELTAWLSPSEIKFL